MLLLLLLLLMLKLGEICGTGPLTEATNKYSAFGASGSVEQLE